MNSPSHSSVHGDLATAIENLEAKVGVTGSAVTTSIDYRVTQVEAKPGMQIGATISGSPAAGSVLYVGAGGVLAQNNANLFWDATNKRLGIGTASPTAPVTINIPSTTLTRNVGLEYKMENGTPLIKFVSLYDPSGGSGYAQIEFYNNKNSALVGSIGFLDNFSGFSFSTLLFAQAGISIPGGGLSVGNYADTQLSGRLTSYASRDLVLQAQSTYQTQIKASSAAAQALVVQGFVSQSANLQEWQNSSGTPLALVTAAGYSSAQRLYAQNTSGMYIYNRAGAADTFTVASVFGDCFEYNATYGYFAASNMQFFFGNAPYTIGGSDCGLARSSSGVVSITDGTGGSGLGSLLVGTSSAARVALTVKGASAQSANLQAWQDSSGTAKSFIDAQGGLTINSTSGYYPLVIKDFLGNLGARFEPDGSLLVNGNIQTATGIRVTAYGAYMGVLSGQRFVFNNNGIVTYGLSTTDTVFAVRGVASQSGNLQEWQNSSGTVLTVIKADGTISSPGAGSGSEHFGLSSTAPNPSTLAIGNGATIAVSAGGGGEIAIGASATANSGGGNGAMALGAGATATGNKTTAIGNSANAANGSFAFGYAANATGVYAIAMGYLADASTYSSIVISPGGGGPATADHQLLLGGLMGYSDTRDAYFGSGVTNATPQNVTLNATGASGTNIAGANIAIAAGKATGNAVGGSILFQTPDATTSGTTLQSLSTKLTIAASGNVLVNGFSASTVGLTVKAAASQSANLQEWQDNSSSPLLSVTSKGILNLIATTPTAGHITQAGSRLLHTYGSVNVFVGVNSGNFTLGPLGGGHSNVGVGTNTLQAITEGYSNVGLGYNALVATTTGIYNIGIGRDGLASNTTGSYNVAVGGAALGANTTGDYGTAFGYSALFSQTTGSGNTAVGQQSARQTTTGSANTAIGNSALHDNATTSSNTAIGEAAFYDLTSGGGNVGIGNNAGRAVTTATNCTFVGFDAGYLSLGTSNGLTNAAAFGYKAQVTQGNSLILGGIGSDSVQVGINTTAPSGQFDVIINSASRIGQIIKGASSQSANLQEWQNSSGTALAYVSSSGYFTSAGLQSLAGGQIYSGGINVADFFNLANTNTLSTTNAAYRPLTVKGFSSQSANLQEWQKSDATVYSTVSENGYYTTRKNSAPADAELAAGEAAYWFDSTNGAARFCVKGKTNDGTVVNGSLTLA